MPSGDKKNITVKLVMECKTPTKETAMDKVELCDH